MQATDLSHVSKKIIIVFYVRFVIPSGSQEPVGIKNKGLAREDRSFILFCHCPRLDIEQNHSSHRS